LYVFVQLKPLTEEEKRQKLAELKEKMADKRARKAEEESVAAKANEAIRRKKGQVCLLFRAFPLVWRCGPR
jgi:hypothetical protein